MFIVTVTKKKKKKNRCAVRVQIKRGHFYCVLTTGITAAEYHIKEGKNQEDFSSDNKFSYMELYIYCSISIHYSIRIFRHYSDLKQKHQIN